MFMISNPCSIRPAVSHEKKPNPGLTRRLMRAMILFNEVVEVFALPQFTTFWKNIFHLQLHESLWIRRVFVNRDDARDHGVASTQCFREKALRSRCIARGTQQKLQRVPDGESPARYK